MSADERVSVKTRVPKPQKSAWQEHAEALDMSQSEFVATMVQAGRRGFELEPPEPPSVDANPRGDGLREPVLEALSADEHREFDEIVESLHSHFQRLVDDTLSDLRNEGQVEFSNLDGYSLTEGYDGDD